MRKDLVTLLIAEFSDSARPFDRTPTGGLDITRLYHFSNIVHEIFKNSLL
ncbi:hypothetical protein ASZ90_012434 [hydrocarbon metagenome]|uniref:Uncharacterized protein n=1 Tax=hydrocarbon metagenome TaxID=938273 RepID=A0A0W8FAG8_9ZZZZ